MRRPRELHEYERYLRYPGPIANLTGSVNLALSPGVFQLAPAIPIENYFIPAFGVTLIGDRLLTNLHQFGAYGGKFILEYWSKDEIGTLWEQWSMTRSEIGTSEDWLRGTANQMQALAQLTEPGTPFAPGVLTLQYVSQSALNVVKAAWPPFVQVPLPTVPVWTSETISVSMSDEIQFVAWTLKDSTDKNGIALNKYWIDLQYSAPDGAAGAVSLTHWPVAAIPAPLTDPMAVPTPPPFDFAIPQVFQQRSRTLHLRASSLKVVVYVDVSDPAVAAATHLDDLPDKPPLIERIGIYSKIGTQLVRAFAGGNPIYASQSGRRRLGEFDTLRDLMEFAGGFVDNSLRRAYNSKDVLHLQLPLSCRLSGKSEEVINGRFIPDSAGNGLDIIEVKAMNGVVSYERDD